MIFLVIFELFTELLRNDENCITPGQSTELIGVATDDKSDYRLALVGALCAKYQNEIVDHLLSSIGPHTLAYMTRVAQECDLPTDLLSRLMAGSLPFFTKSEEQFEIRAEGKLYRRGCISGRQLNWTTALFWGQNGRQLSGRHLFFSKKTGRHVNFHVQIYSADQGCKSSPACNIFDQNLDAKNRDLGQNFDVWPNFQCLADFSPKFRCLAKISIYG